MNFGTFGRQAIDRFAGNSNVMEIRGGFTQWILPAYYLHRPQLPQEQKMARTGAITFKGNPMTLVGEELKVGANAPDFTLHYFDGGLKTITLADLKGKPSIISIVPSLDTGVCQLQTKHFNQELAALGDKINAVTVSRDLPFAMNRFCGAEEIKSMRVGSDYQSGDFGQKWGLTIDELKLLARAVYVLDANGKVIYAEIVPEVAQEPKYEPAIAALKGAL